MAGNRKIDKQIEIENYTHSSEKRKNNPSVGLVSNSTDKVNQRTKYQYDPHIDPTLSWAGKAEGMDVKKRRLRSGRNIGGNKIEILKGC